MIQARTQQGSGDPGGVDGSKVSKVLSPGCPLVRASSTPAEIGMQVSLAPCRSLLGAHGAFAELLGEALSANKSEHLILIRTILAQDQDQGGNRLDRFRLRRALGS